MGLVEFRICGAYARRGVAAIVAVLTAIAMLVIAMLTGGVYTADRLARRGAFIRR